MKLKLLLAVTISGLLFSCSDDDDKTTVPADSGVAGVYLLTAFNTSVPTDLNSDGTASTNQMDETVCFNGTTMILNSDNTFSRADKGIDISDDGTNPSTIECYDDGIQTGTWIRMGNVVSLTYTYDGDIYTDNFDVANNTLTYSLEDADVVGTSNGEPVYVTTAIDIIFTKQ